MDEQWWLGKEPLARPSLGLPGMDIVSARSTHPTITQWDCFESHGNEMEHRFLRETPLPRDPSMLEKGLTWGYIVKEFTRREISEDKDRLPALAGLAEKFRDVTGFEYLAGIWRQELPGALLWVRSGDDYLRSPEDRRVPPWSWASLEGGVEALIWNWVGTPTWLISVILAECTYWPPDTLSRVKSAWLDVEGLMSPVTERTTVTVGHLDFVDGEDLHWNVKLDQDTCSEEDIAKFNVYLLWFAEGRFDWGLVSEKTERSGGKDTFVRHGRAMKRHSERLTRQVGCWEKKVIRLV